MDSSALVQVYGRPDVGILISATEGEDLFIQLIPVVRKFLKQHGTIPIKGKTLFDDVLETLKAKYHTDCLETSTRERWDDGRTVGVPPVTAAYYYAVTKDGTLLAYKGDQFLRSADGSVSAGESQLREMARSFGNKKQKSDADRAARNKRTTKSLRLKG